MPEAPRERWNPAELAHLRRARDLINRSYAEPLDVPAMARAARMSPSHFARRFRAAYGETPYGFLMTRRVERAMALLRRGDLSVTDVCMAVGATSLGSFSSRFTELVGQTPSAYRTAHRTDRDTGAVSPPARPARAGTSAVHADTSAVHADTSAVHADMSAMHAGASAVPACVAREWLRPAAPRSAPPPRDRRPRPDRPGSDRTGPDRTGPDRTGPDRAGSEKPVGGPRS